MEENKEEQEKKTYLKFDSEKLEKIIVSFLLRNRSAFLKIGKYLKTNDWRKNSYFIDSKLQWIINTSCIFNDTQKKPITIELLEVYIDRCYKKDEFLKTQFLSLIKELKNTNLDEIPEDYILQEATNFIKRERAIEATYENQIDIENGNYDNLSKRIQEAVNINLDKDLGVSIKDVSTALSLIKDIKDKSNGCTYGSEQLNNNLGRMMPGELIVFCGVPGIGKTTWLAHIAKSNFEENKNVIIFSFEVNEQRLTTRLYKSIFQLGANKILDLDEKEAADAFKQRDGDVRIISRGANKCSCNDMAAVLYDLETYENFKPDLIEIDYILITSTNDKKADSSQTYKYYKTVAEEMRNLAKDFNCPVVSCAQINREGMGEKGGTKKITTSKDLSESRGILDTVDYLLTINQTPEEKFLSNDRTKGIYRIFVDKNRNGDNNNQYSFDVDWSTLCITDKIKNN